MNINTSKIKWLKVKDNLDESGYSWVQGILPPEVCDSLISLYPDNKNFRSTISMKRYNFGRGEYKYFNYPLPDTIQYLRTILYKELSVIANAWFQKLNIEKAFPPDLETLLDQCHQNGQHRPTPLILKYETGDYNTLHQDLYGEIFFPFQAVLFLTEVGQDYTGGEFVLIEQRPRLQSRAIVLQPGKGDIVIFATNFRAAKGGKGYYRAPMKHGVSELHSGCRYNAGIIFHDAT